jgi:hypothetical protein
LVVEERRNRTHTVRSWLAAAAVAMLLLVLCAAPISAAAGSTKLSGAGVSPRTGTPASTIVITVTYSSDKGWAAERVTARVGTIDKTMSRVSGSDWRKGVTYRWSGKLPLGSYSVVITARSTHKGVATTGAGTVKIVPAKPKATPEPARATPKPTPKPTARPTLGPRPTAAPIIAPLAGPTATPLGNPFGTLFPNPVPSATPSPLPLTAFVGGTTGTTPPGSDGTSGPRGGSGQPTGGWGPVASLLAMTGFHGPSFPGLTIGPTLVTTTGAVALGMAFGLFGRKRREDESDDVLSAAAASGVGFMQHDGAVAVHADGIAAASGAMLDVDDTEALMPRWRRPSLMAARKADPVRDTAPAPRLTFDQGLVGPLDDGRERKVIRYRVVRLLDSPDELRGQEIGYLDQGDEVQLLEKYGAYWLVLSPDGQQGWLHKMTLGDVWEDNAPPSEGPVATMPIAAETWTMGEADIDGDVFEAYLESRRRRGD